MLPASNRYVRPLWIGLRMISAAKDANSDDVPMRFGKRNVSMSPCLTDGGTCVYSGVSKAPGAIVTTRIPCADNSRMSGMVIPTSAALDAAYAICPTCPSKAAPEATLMTTPRSPSIDLHDDVELRHVDWAVAPD